MTIIRVAAIFAFLWCTSGADEMRPVPLEQARALIEASVPLNGDAGLTFSETVETVSADGTNRRTVTYEWRVRGNLYVDSVMCRVRAEGESPSVIIRHGNAQYNVFMVGKRWQSRTRAADAQAFPGSSGYQRRLRPFGSDTWDITVRKLPLADAVVTAEGHLVATFVASQSVADAMVRGGPISGFGGWRCTLVRNEGKYDLARIEQFATKTVSPSVFQILGDEQPNPELLTGPEAKELTVLGKVYGVRAVTQFSEYVTIGQARLPRRCEHLSWRALAVSRLEAGSLRVERHGDDVFAFRAPTEFGVDGVHIDEVAGGGRYFGEVVSDKDKMLDTIGEHARERVKDDGGVALRVAVAVIVGACAAWGAARYMRRRRAQSCERR